MKTIEDLLEYVMHVDKSAALPHFTVNTEDKDILSSISRQVYRGIALTDRQYALCKEKLKNYAEEFEQINVSVDQVVEHLRSSIREINREQYVKISLDKKFIEVRFPFSKKNIVTIEKIANKFRSIYSHAKGTHVHQFKLTEPVVKEVVESFINKQFVIDNELLEYYNEIMICSSNKYDYIPTYKNHNFINISDHAITSIVDNLNNCVTDLKLFDRRKRFGLVLDNIEIPDVSNYRLLHNVVHRPSAEIAIPPNQYSINDVVLCLSDLDRFPLLVLLDEVNCLDQLTVFHNAVKEIVPSENQTVLFRVEGNSSQNEFNEFVREKKLNNWLDDNTQIVYIKKAKLPKLLLKTAWRPITALGLTSYRSNTTVNIYIKDYCDLIMYHDKELSLMKDASYYGNL
jgi:hypothetical protein